MTKSRTFCWHPSNSTLHFSVQSLCYFFSFSCITSKWCLAEHFTTVLWSTLSISKWPFAVPYLSVHNSYLICTKVGKLWWETSVCLFVFSQYFALLLPSLEQDSTVNSSSFSRVSAYGKAKSTHTKLLWEKPFLQSTHNQDLLHESEGKLVAF